MRRVAAMMFGLAIAAACVATASAESRWYVSGSVGGYFREDSSAAETFTRIGLPVGAPHGVVVAQPPPPPPIPVRLTTKGTQHFSYESGVVADVALGYRLRPRLRVEADLGYADYAVAILRPIADDPNFPRLNGQPIYRRSGADVSRFTGSANGFYDFAAPGSRLTPYVGLGVGGSANHRASGVFVRADGSTFSQVGGSTTQGFGLLEAGLNIALSRRWSIVPAYRYVHLFSAGQDVAHVLKLGVGYSF